VKPFQDSAAVLPEGMRVKAPTRNLAGQKIGRLLCIEVVGKAENNSLIWRCICDCGKSIERRASSFRTGKVASCGCYLKDKNKSHMLAIGPWNKGATYSNTDLDAEFVTRSAWSKAIIRERGNACEICGWAEAKCDVHHRIPRHKGGKNTRANGIVVCPNHHRIAHEKGTLQ